nr:hypothetical protein [Tanacetum cinerariifolium]
MVRDSVQLETTVNTISHEYLLEFTSEYGIAEMLHPELPGLGDRIVDFPEGKVGVYTRFFEFANFRLPLSQFLFDVLGRVCIPHCCGLVNKCFQRWDAGEWHLLRRGCEGAGYASYPHPKTTEDVTVLGRYKSQILSGGRGFDSCPKSDKGEDWEPIEHVADEAVYKELDDSLVRAATIASSLEAEQDSAMGDTIAQTRHYLTTMILAKKNAHVMEIPPISAIVHSMKLCMLRIIFAIGGALLNETKRATYILVLVSDVYFGFAMYALFRWHDHRLRFELLFRLKSSFKNDLMIFPDVFVACLHPLLTRAIAYMYILRW